MSETNLDPRSVDRGYEVRDLSARAIAFTLLGLFLLGVLIHYCLYWQFQGMARERAARDRPVSAFQGGEVRPPEPRIDALPQDELRKLREEEARILDGYAWIDRSAGVVRIPIAKAMDLLAGRGLPVRTPGTTVPSGPPGILPPWVPPTIEAQMFQGVPPPLAPPAVSGRPGPPAEDPAPPPGSGR
jgi:hypothetical protein